MHNTTRRWLIAALVLMAVLMTLDPVAAAVCVQDPVTGTRYCTDLL